MNLIIMRIKTKIIFISLMFYFVLYPFEKKVCSETYNKGIPVYNQAYQENFEEDKIEDIIKNAHNAFVLLDPFQNSNADYIPKIKAKGNIIAGYISIGTGENFRSDFKEMKECLVTKAWKDWPDEYFVNTINAKIVKIMKSRIDKIADLGCDWIEFDNMDWIYDKELKKIYKFKVTESEGVAYYQELCIYAHTKGLKCLAKNTVQNASCFDGVLYESYPDNFNWWDQEETIRFLNANKLVIICHYNETNSQKVYERYKEIYNAKNNNKISFICEDKKLKKYVHFNE